MRKIFALFTNEMIKISKKISIIIIFAIIVAAIFGFGGLMKYMEMRSNQESMNGQSQSWMKENMQANINDNKQQLTQIQKAKSTAKDTEIANLEAEELTVQNRIDMYQYALDKNIMLDNPGYLAQTVQILFNNKQIVSQFSKLPADGLTTEQKKQLSDAQNNIPRAEKTIENKDFKEFIAMSNEEINNNTTNSSDEKKIFLESNALRLKYNVTGETKHDNVYLGGSDYVTQIENAKFSLLNNIDQTGQSQSQKPLTEELREKIKNNMAVAEYKLAHGIATSNDMDIKSATLIYTSSIGTLLVLILIMILAGGSFSSEMSTGSIKSLIVSPTKRWKIFAAKLMSLLTLFVIGVLFVYAFVTLAHGVYFGFNSGSPYIYAQSGVVYELNFYVYQLLKLFLDSVYIVIFLVLALMLSVTTRNTAVSVSIPLAVAIVGISANQMVMRLLQGEWQKFNPFNNMDLTSKIFPDATNQAIASMEGYVNNSLTFTSVYIAVMLLCMMYVALDSFKRRDIK